MDAEALNHRASAAERRQFETEGFLIVPAALPPSLVGRLVETVDRIDAEHRARCNAGPHERVQLVDFIGKDEIFLDLLDWPQTFPKVWELLGWNIQLYYTAMTVTPPLPAADPALGAALNWHQDSGEINPDLETDPRPRVSLKVGFFLTDTTVEGSANLMVLPGSHLSNDLPLARRARADDPKPVALRLPAGAAVIFDRRLWHAASPNGSRSARKVLFYGYSYRWLRPRGSMMVEHLLAQCDPIRRALFNPDNSWGQNRPLGDWLQEHGVLDPESA